MAKKNSPSGMALQGNTKHPLHTAPLGRNHGQKAGSPALKGYITGQKPPARPASGMGMGMSMLDTDGDID